MRNRPIYLFSISSHPNAVSVPSLTVTLLKPQIDFSKYDYFIITSKQVCESLKQYETQLYINKPALCVSKASAVSYEDLGGQVLATGGGYGDDLVEKIKEYPKDTKWLYLRAKIVASNFAQICQSDGYNIDEAIVYESECSSEIYSVSVEEYATLIFTSPSSLNCFLKTHQLSADNTIIVIGKTTAKALPKGVKYHISEKTTIESCMELSYTLEKKDAAHQLTTIKELEKFNGEDNFYKSLLVDFEKIYAKSLATLIEDNKYKEALMLTKDVKDVALNIGAATLSQSVAALEYELEREDHAMILKSLYEYERHLTKLLTELNEYLGDK